MNNFLFLISILFLTACKNDHKIEFKDNTLTQTVGADPSNPPNPAPTVSSTTTPVPSTTNPEPAPNTNTSGPITFSDRTKTVSTKANGNGDGSDNYPWSLQQAMQLAQAGDVVGIESGVYIGSDPGSFHRGHPAFSPINSGEKDRPIIFIAQHLAAKTETKYTDIRSGALTAKEGWPAFGSLNSDYIHWIGIYSNENDPQNNQSTDSAPATFWQSNGSRLSYTKIVGSGNYNGDNHSGVRIEYSNQGVFSDNVISGFKGQTNKAGFIVYKSNSFIIENNKIFNNQHGIQLKGADGTKTIYGVNIRKNKMFDNYDAFRLHGPVLGPNGELSLIYQNVIYNSTRMIELTSSATHNGEHDGLRIFNNTISNVSGNDPAAISIYSNYDAEGPSVRNNFVFNNIFSNVSSFAGLYSSSKSNASHINNFMQSDYNCFHNLSQIFNGSSSGDLDSTTLEIWQENYNQDLHSIYGQAKFLNVSDHDFRIQPDSDCALLGVDKLNITGLGVDTAINSGAFITGDETIGVR